jgi:hypothetical protein
MEESKRLRTAKALDEFEGLFNEQVGLPLRKEVRAASHVQNVLAVSIRKTVEQIADEYGLEFDTIWVECMALARERMEKAVDGLCDTYRSEPLIENGKAVGQKITYYMDIRRLA